MSKRWIYVDGQAYDADGYVPERHSTSFQVMPDIQPYQSMITGEEITSRSRHREHLKAHGCVEVGNEVPHMVKNMHKPAPPPGLRDALMQAAHRHGIFKT